MPLTIGDMAYELAEREVLFTPWQHVMAYWAGDMDKYAKAVHKDYTELPELIILDRYNQMTGEQNGEG